MIGIEHNDAGLQLKISDNGVGLEPKDAGRSLGLLGMEERARLIGARFTAHGAPGMGTVVSVHLPVTGGSSS